MGDWTPGVMGSGYSVKVKMGLIGIGKYNMTQLHKTLKDLKQII